MADTNTEYNLEEEIDEENDVISINLGDSTNSETRDSIEHCLEETLTEKASELEPSFTNPIYGENQDNSKPVESEAVPQHYFPEDRWPPLDRLLRQTGSVDISYNVHSALDRVLKSVEDTDSGDETSNLIYDSKGLGQYKAPIDRTIASIRNKTALNSKHPIDRVIVTATQNSGEGEHPVVDKIAKTVRKEGPVDPRNPIDRLATDDSTPGSVKRLFTTLCEEVDVSPAASSKPIDKLMRAALIDDCASHANPNNPLHRLVNITLHSTPQYDNRKPIDRLTQSLTGKTMGKDESINTATPLARLERTLTSK